MTTKENEFMRDFRRLLKQYDVSFTEEGHGSFLNEWYLEDTQGEVALNLETIIEELEP